VPRSPLHAVFGVLGPVAGLVAAVYLHNRGWTLPSVLLAFGVVSAALAWGLPDAIVGPRRIARLAFWLLPISTGLGGFAAAALAWGPTWPALLVGGLLGAAVETGLQRTLFPDLAQEGDLRRGVLPRPG
jgi:hypothetical protein